MAVFTLHCTIQALMCPLQNLRAELLQPASSYLDGNGGGGWRREVLSRVEWRRSWRELGGMTAGMPSSLRLVCS